MASVAERTLETRPMTARQLVAIGVCVLLNALDGFDVLAISFASPCMALSDQRGTRGGGLVAGRHAPPLTCPAAVAVPPV